MAIKKNQLSAGGEVGENIVSRHPKRFALLIPNKLWLKKHKLAFISCCFLLVAIIAGLGAYQYYRSHYYISEQEQSTKLSEARSLLQQSFMSKDQNKVKQAEEKYNYVADRKHSNTEKAEVYNIESQNCASTQQYGCALAAWQLYGQYKNKDGDYYVRLATLFRANADTTNETQALNSALDQYQQVQNPSKEVKDNIEGIKRQIQLKL